MPARQQRRTKLKRTHTRRLWPRPKLLYGAPPPHLAAFVPPPGAAYGGGGRHYGRQRPLHRCFKGLKKESVEGSLARVWEGLGGPGSAWEAWEAWEGMQGAGKHFFWLRGGGEQHENLENVESLLDPACSSYQSQPAHLARDAPSPPAWVEEGFRAHLEKCGFGRGLARVWRVWESGRAWEWEGTQGPERDPGKGFQGFGGLLVANGWLRVFEGAASSPRRDWLASGC